MRLELDVFEEMAPLPRVGPGRVLQQQRNALARLLEIDAVLDVVNRRAPVPRGKTELTVRVGRGLELGGIGEMHAASSAWGSARSLQCAP